MKIKKTTVSALMLSCIALAGCSSKPKEAGPTPDQSAAIAKLASLQQVVAQTAQTYKQMDTPSLLKKLMEQSAAQKEPFNSPAYRELKGRTDVSAESLVSLIREAHNGTALLPLLLLRKSNGKAYAELPTDLRANVLTDALQNTKKFNAWGLPGFYLEDAAQALIESGKSAEPALKKMLSDTRPAPVFGSQEFMLYQRYKFRVCDYALFFLEKIQGKADFKMPESPGDRDSLIKGIAK